MRLKLVAALALIVVGVAAVGIVIFAPGIANGQASTQYLTAQATTTDVTQQAVATGNLAAATTYSLAFGQAPQLTSSSSSSSSGGGSGTLTWPVKEVKVAVGDSVKKGAVLATADSAAAVRALRTAQASLASAHDRLNADLGNTNATLAQIASDRANVADLQAQVDDAQTAVDQATLKAPADGIVTAVNVVTGFDAPSGAAIELAGGGLQVEASFTETDVPSLKSGQPATVTITSLGATAEGTVTLVEPIANSSGNSSVVTYTAQVTLTNPPAAARPGMSVSVAVTTAQATNVLAVPAIALIGSSGNYEVRVVAADGQVSLVPVQVGLVTSSTAEITSGLSAGDSVVVGTSTQRTGTTTTGTGLPGIFSGGGGGRNFGGNGGRNIVTNP
jgi:RND family efflux transporter MFP subunit